MTDEDKRNQKCQLHVQLHITIDALSKSQVNASKTVGDVAFKILA